MKKIDFENISIALNSIRSHRTRTFLTISIIAFGIMALVGILTATDAIEASINMNFTSMGANTFSISSDQFRGEGHRRNRGGEDGEISYNDAALFKKKYTYPSIVSLNFQRSMTMTLKYMSEKTNPNVTLFAIDENYFLTSGNSMALGRNFSPEEALNGDYEVILGQKVADELFKNTNPIDKEILVGSIRYRVIGVLKSKGSSFGFNGDRNCFLPLNNVRQAFPSNNISVSINVMTLSKKPIDEATTEAQGLFRIIRKLRPSDEDNFRIEKSDNLANELNDQLK